MPALFGQSMAAYVLCDLAGKKINPGVVARLSRDQRNKLYQKLQQREHVLFHEELHSLAHYTKIVVVAANSLGVVNSVDILLVEIASSVAATKKSVLAARVGDHYWKKVSCCCRH
ncbi:hypothetical protein PR003_g9905 [Phytophthora rubi]|uniref:Uncharacterized protein n=2 Tax=Phytophthora rubi TaxID=129364 RepID=A0A6A3LSH7_9STRA|nr:hypothetical protein PR001_g13198 [Phytophthora rubi]KAE9341587.1 hypothetical protein PR003_g9905 [Phytophthora rubi]